MTCVEISLKDLKYKNLQLFHELTQLLRWPGLEISVMQQSGVCPSVRLSVCLSYLFF